MIRRLVLLIIPALAVTTPLAAVAGEAEPSGTFSATTGASPAAFAVGEWSSETNGRRGQLDARVGSLDGPAETEFVATWISERRRLEPDDQFLVGEVLMRDSGHRAATSTSVEMTLEYRVQAGDAPWGGWQAVLDSKSRNSLLNREERLEYAQIVVGTECACDHQLELRIRGVRKGSGVSDLSVTTGLR